MSPRELLASREVKWAESTTVTSHQKLLYTGDNFTDALASKAARRFKAFLPFLAASGDATWSGIQWDTVRRGRGKKRNDGPFSPVFLFKQSKSIRKKKLSGAEPFRETWPWGSPENNLSRPLLGARGLWSHDCSAWNTPGRLLYIMIPVLMARGNVWSQMESSIEYNLRVSRRARGTSSFIPCSESHI